MKNLFPFRPRKSTPSPFSWLLLALSPARLALCRCLYISLMLYYENAFNLFYADMIRAASYPPGEPFPRPCCKWAASVLPFSLLYRTGSANDRNAQPFKQSTGKERKETGSKQTEADGNGGKQSSKKIMKREKRKGNALIKTRF